MSHFVTDGSERVGIGRDGTGTSAAEKPYTMTLFGNGRDWLESPSVGSTPGHPKNPVILSKASRSDAKSKDVFKRLFRHASSLLDPRSNTCLTA